MTEGWQTLKGFLVAYTGLAYYHKREDQLLRAVRPRMEATGQECFDSYLNYLKNTSEEVEKIVARLTVGETYFFRDRPQFQALNDTVLADLARKSGSQRVRVWSAGCSIGAEPYSLACLAYSNYQAQLHPLTILATDINQEALKIARQAVFSEWALRNVEPIERELYFIQEEEELWRLRPHLGQGVTFQHHNLVDGSIPPSAEKFDLITCRNVLIYFDQERIRETLDLFYQALAPGGWLVVGYSEPNTELFRQFEMVSLAQTILYRRPSSPLSLPAPESLPSLNLPLETVAVPKWSYPSPEPEELPPGPSSPPVTLEELPPGPSPPPATLEELKAHADAGLWLEARELAGKLLSLDPLQPRAHFYLALVQEQLGEHQESRRSYRQAIYLDRNDPLPHYYLGLSQSRDGSIQDAVRSFRTVVRLMESLPADKQDLELEGISVSQLRALASGQLKVLQSS